MDGRRRRADGPSPASLGFGPDDDLHVVTAGRGVYRSTSAVAAGPEAVRADLGVTVFPTPFAASRTVRFALDAPGRVRVAVYDALGRRVAAPGSTRGPGLRAPRRPTST